MLKDIFLNGESKRLRKWAASKVDDDDFFLQIIIGEYDRELRITALVSLENEENLIKVAYNFKDPEFSKHAIDLIIMNPSYRT